MRRPPAKAASLDAREKALVQGGRHVREDAAQLAAQPLNDRDDRNRDTGGDQAVFDGRGAFFIAQEIPKQFAHGMPSLRASSPTATCPKCSAADLRRPVKISASTGFLIAPHEAAAKFQNRAVPAGSG